MIDPDAWAADWIKTVASSDHGKVSSMLQQYKDMHQSEKDSINEAMIRFYDDIVKGKDSVTIILEEKA